MGERLPDEFADLRAAYPPLEPNAAVARLSLDLKDADMQQKVQNDTELFYFNWEASTLRELEWAFWAMLCSCGIFVREYVGLTHGSQINATAGVACPSHVIVNSAYGTVILHVVTKRIESPDPTRALLMRLRMRFDPYNTVANLLEYHKGRLPEQLQSRQITQMHPPDRLPVPAGTTTQTIPWQALLGQLPKLVLKGDTADHDITTKLDMRSVCKKLDCAIENAHREDVANKFNATRILTECMNLRTGILCTMPKIRTYTT